MVATNNFTENLTFGQRSKEGRGGSSERDTHSRQQRAGANSPRQGHGWPSKGSGGRGRGIGGGKVRGGCWKINQAG